MDKWLAIQKKLVIGAAVSLTATCIYFAGYEYGVMLGRDSVLVAAGRIKPTLPWWQL